MKPSVQTPVLLKKRNSIIKFLILQRQELRRRNILSLLLGVSDYLFMREMELGPRDESLIPNIDSRSGTLRVCFMLSFALFFICVRALLK
jgi:hypothetical protein